MVSDMHNAVTAPILEKMLRAGCDNLMSTNSGNTDILSRPASATTLHRLRTAVKNVCYRLVNSNLMQGIPPSASFQYGLSSWRIALIALNACVFALLIAGGAACLAGGRSRRGPPRA